MASFAPGFAYFEPPAVPKMQIIGADSQVLEVVLSPGETISSEPGNMLHQTSNLNPDMSMDGCWDACRRSCCANESCLRVKYTNESDQDGYIGITPAFPAKVVPINLTEHPGMFIKAGSYMAHIGDDVNIEMHVTSCMAGCFGGAGFIINELKGSGWAFLNAGGTILQKQLAEGEVLLCDTTSVLAFENSVKYDVALAGNCCMVCCGGEGMFNTKLTGPGLVILQSMPFEKLAKAIAALMPPPNQQGANGGQ